MARGSSVGGQASRHHKFDEVMRDDPVVCVRQFDEDSVRTDRQTRDDQRTSARVGPTPRGVVNCHVEMANPWRNRNRGRAERRQYP